MTDSISVNLLIRRDIDPELYEALNNLEKGKVRSEFLRRLLSQAKIKTLLKAHTATQQEPKPIQKKLPPAETPQAPATKPTVTTVSREQPAVVTDFEAEFTAQLGGIPQR